ncbi:T9SS type A sorting domain-containing protein [Polaribacter haliotis]|uniref:T9SS type A sorting domain-containing protein n=1 Tax=Polaribacter haliotis TaxID=1888915 RepID=A0A7L8AJ02_9FLAO|nr:T9SS type A sorting domain-containing protein [Polaribacter haliotis]QOD61779.1 T9SS type A sorting domain-containing protein [Polaribacter haliotis]
MKKLLLLFILIHTLSYSQNKKIENLSCATEWTSENEIYFKNVKKVRKKQTFKLTSNANIPIKVHIVRNSDGSGGISETGFNTILSELNAAYLPMKMSFYLCEDINYIDNSEYYTFDKSEENDLANSTEVIQVINIYFVNSIAKNGDSVGGYAYIPYSYLPYKSSLNRIFIANTNSSTLIHEIGHFFSLPHTHGTSNSTLTNELVDGSNCSSEGDKFCDTPADPNLLNKVNSECKYNETTIDANGDLYKPLTNNYMSYSRSSCKNSFTPEQQSAIVETLLNERSYLAYNNNFSVQFNAEKCDEENNLEPQNNTRPFPFYNSDINNIKTWDCLSSSNDIDWIAEIKVNNINYAIKVESANNSVGRYFIDIETSNNVITIETRPGVMLTDTKLFLYDGTKTKILAEDDNSGLYNFSKIVYDTSNSLNLMENYFSETVIYPNPAKNRLYIKKLPKSSFYHIEIINILGKKKSLKFKEENIKINLNNYSKGFYTLKIKTEIGIITRKIIIQ